ncbi:MAG: S9 family peptidase [Prevotellaceae bacterium]|nr:S9 family peptidase [Prevotellaceae bacterium]
MAVMAAAACGKKDGEEKFQINNQLTQEEKSRGVLTPEILWKFGQVGEPRVSPNGKHVAYTVKHFNLAENRGVSSVYLIAASGESEPQKLTDESGSEQNLRWSKNGETLYFVSDRSGSKQIWGTKPFAKEPEQWQISDVKEGVESFEFSPNGDMILYAKRVKVNKTTEDLYPQLPKASARIITDLMYRHWDTWDNGAYSHLFVAGFTFDRLTGEKDINEGEAWDTPMATDFSISDVSWDASGKYIYYASKKLVGKEYAISTNSDIFRYNVENGETENITLENKGYDRKPLASPDGKKLAWLSMETPGYESDKNRLMLLDIESGKIEELTEKLDQSADQLCWSDDSQTLYFVSGIKATYQIYAANIAEKNIRQLTAGAHDFTHVNVKNSTIVGLRMSISAAPELFRITPGDSLNSCAQITTTNAHLYNNLRFGNVEERWVKTTDNKQMLTWVVFPPNFDPEKKYPALLYCQGGPQQAVSQFWSWRWNLQLLAAQGYIVVAPNRRGVPTFGSKWCAQISGDYSGQNIKDYYSAIDAVKKESYVDANRLGALGASYGGYSVYYLAGTHNRRFKAFAAHNGVFNFESMYGATEETFFPNYDMKGAYWENEPKTQAVYEKSPHKLVAKWNTPILISVGEHDYRVPYTEGLQAFSAAQLQGIPSKLLYFPDENHHILKPQNAALWHTELLGWFNEYLQK